MTNTLTYFKFGVILERLIKFAPNGAIWQNYDTRYNNIKISSYSGDLDIIIKICLVVEYFIYIVTQNTDEWPYKDLDFTNTWKLDIDVTDKEGIVNIDWVSFQNFLEDFKFIDLDPSANENLQFTMSAGNIKKFKRFLLFNKIKHPIKWLIWWAFLSSIIVEDFLNENCDDFCKYVLEKYRHEKIENDEYI